MDNPCLHAREKESVLKLLSSNEQTGLSVAQVVVAREQYGANELTTLAPESIWKKFLAQFSDIVVWILMAAFAYGYRQEHNLNQARTMTFCVVVYGELFRSLAARSRIWTFWQLRPSTNRHLLAAVTISSLLQVGIIQLEFARPIFAATTHTMQEWLVLGALALTPVTVIELVKLGRQSLVKEIPSGTAGISL